MVFGIDIHTIALYLYSHTEKIVPDAIWGCGPIKSDISHMYVWPLMRKYLFDIAWYNCKQIEIPQHSTGVYKSVLNLKDVRDTY